MRKISARLESFLEHISSIFTLSAMWGWNINAKT